MESEWCGNAPACKKYITKEENIEVKICQQNYEVTDIPETPNKETDEFNKMMVDQKLKEDKHNIYGYNVNHNFISFEVLEDSDAENWKINGIEIVSEKENNTIKVSCVNKKTKSHVNSIDSTQFQLDWYTTISIDLVKTEMEAIDILESVQIICERIKI